MHDILSIESMKLDSDNNIIVTAILENMRYIKGSQTLYDPPEYAPCLCQTIIDNDGIPPWVKLVNDEEELEEVINRYGLLSHQMWEPIIEDDSDRYLDD